MQMCPRIIRQTIQICYSPEEEECQWKGNKTVNDSLTRFVNPIYLVCTRVASSLVFRREVKKLYWGINSRPRDAITLKYYGNEKLSPTRAMFASFSAKDNATTGKRGGMTAAPGGKGEGEGGLGRIYGTLFCKWTFLVRRKIPWI